MLYLNARAEEILGRRRDELIGGLPWIMFREQDRSIIRGLIERPSGARPTTSELMVERPDGKHVPVEMASTRILTVIGTLGFGYFRDISVEREAVRRSGARRRGSGSSSSRRPMAS